MKFQPGQSGNPGGRPKGAVNKDRQNYLDFQLWFKQIFDDINELDNAEKRLNYSLQMTDKLLSKVQNLPSSPSASLENAQARAEMISALENGIKPETQIEPVTPPDGNGAAPQS